MRDFLFSVIHKYALPQAIIFDIITYNTMKRVALFIAVLFGGIGFADAAVRAATKNSAQSSRGISATSTKPHTTNTTQSSRTTTSRTGTSTTTSRVATSQSSRTATSRTATTGSVQTTSRAALPKTVSRAASRSRTATTTAGTSTSRNASKSSQSSRLSRAALMTAAAAGSNTFGSGYNACRDAYFTCMDQFCATMNDTYRRCVCSSRLTEIRERERTLNQTGEQLQDFKDLNLDVITKTGAEVKAMISATAGESAIRTDKSQSAKTLANINDVLSGTKSKAISSHESLDIAGDINSIWATTNLASGTNLANLEGETLYNAVHSQCVDLISKNCPGAATLNMVVSAYGMYIENDCATLTKTIDKKFTDAKSSVRDAENAMHDARLENYDAHNSASINECIAQVRTDITADTACGTDYVHCLDITGKYLNRQTGAALYTPQFFEIENSVSLAGDVLTNTTNRMLVAELNNKKIFAERALNTCTDLADQVWDEFMRQAITEIYQGQRERVRQVKDECLDVVNQCYDTQRSSLRDFSNQKDQLLLGAQLELSEEMCKTKMDACANLYGGSANGLEVLVRTMREITDQKIAKECKATLLEYTNTICRADSTDTTHKYPWGCRTYVPGEQRFALINACNTTIKSDMGNSSADMSNSGKQAFTVNDGNLIGIIQFTSCNKGYYLNNNWCEICPEGKLCPGGTATQITNDTDAACGDYTGSLYHRLVRYAMQACVRPTESTNPLPTRILADINSVMDSIRSNMNTALSTECENLGGEWHSEPNAKAAITTDTKNMTPREKCNVSGGTWHPGITDATGDCKCYKPLFLNDNQECEYKRLDTFYTKTGANTQWGICATTDADTIDAAYKTANVQFQKDRCEHDDGKWTGNTCDCSPANATWDSSNKKCVPCNTGSYSLTGANVCSACTANGYDEQNHQCRCPTNNNYILSTNTCIKCDKRGYNPTKYECRCSEGLEWNDQAQECRCPADTVWNTTTKKCETQTTT